MGVFIKDMKDARVGTPIPHLVFISFSEGKGIGAFQDGAHE